MSAKGRHPGLLYIEGGLATLKKQQMAPGPTELTAPVRQAMSQQLINPDLDPAYVSFYADMCGKIQQLLHTEADCLVLSGEGILGLEAACASLVEPGIQVLCLVNGVFGAGFVDFVKAYGGIPVVIEKDYRQAFTAADVEAALEQHPDVKLTTVVHCDTPSGMLNPLQEIGPVLKRHGVISIVDAVASLGGDIVLADEWGLDVVLGGSQKALSAPPGLTLLSVSPQAWEFMQARHTPPVGLYLNLLTWKNGWLQDGSFPYTQPVNDHYALDAALAAVLAEGDAIYERHRTVAHATRQTLRAAGLSLYPEPQSAAHTVTAISVPEGVPDAEFRQRLLEKYNMQIAGSYGPLAGKVWRIGHMGSQCCLDKVRTCLQAMEACLHDFGLEIEISRHLN